MQRLPDRPGTGKRASPRGNHYEDGWKLALTPGTSEQILGLRPEGSYLDGASTYGVLDLTGNASEWIADWYNPSFYSDMPAGNPVGLDPAWQHSVRGSAWYDRAGYESWMLHESRCSARNASHFYDAAGFSMCAKFSLMKPVQT